MILADYRHKIVAIVHDQSRELDTEDTFGHHQRWYMSEDDGNDEGGLTRRGMLRRAGALGVAGVVGVGGFQYFAAEPVFALEEQTFTADDVSITSADGSINDIWFQPKPTYSWSALDSSPESITFTLEAEGNNLSDWYETMGSETAQLSDVGESGEGEYTFENKLSLLDNSKSWTKWEFQADEDGETETVGPIGVKITAELETTDGATHTDTNQAEFSVDVTNQQVEFGDHEGDSGNGGVGGIAGTGGN